MVRHTIANANTNVPAQPTIYFRTQPDGNVRVWRSDWQGDQFNVVEKETFKFVEQTFRTFGFLVREYADEADDEK